MLIAGAFADAGSSVCAQLLIPAVLSWTSQDGTQSSPEALRHLFCRSPGFPSEPLLLCHLFSADLTTCPLPQSPILRSISETWKLDRRESLRGPLHTRHAQLPPGPQFLSLTLRLGHAPGAVPGCLSPPPE